ncbi:Spore germination protein YaaH [compost metagenome]
MRKISKLILAASIATGGLFSMGSTEAQASSAVQILLDGYPLSFSGDPIIMKGTTMVPFRSISEAMGITVTWDQATKTITAIKDEGTESTQVRLTLNNQQAIVNGSSIQLAVAPQAVQGNTLIPLSFFSQQFGAAVGWNQATKTVSITSPQKKMYTLGFYAISSFSEAANIPRFDSIGFGWSRIDENGRFTTTGKDFKLPLPAGDVTAESLVSNASSASTSPYLMVYSGDTKGELTKIVENAEYRAQAITDMITTAKELQFEGILLDFEGLGLTTDKTLTQTAFTAFVKEVDTAATAAGLKLSLALHPLNSSYQGYDYKALGQLADELIIMAYDYQASPGNSKQPEPVDKVNEAIQLALKQTDKDKLILGLNVYNENADSISTLIGLAKRYDLKGIAVWRLGLTTSDEWASMQQSIEFKQ